MIISKYETKQMQEMQIFLDSANHVARHVPKMQDEKMAQMKWWTVFPIKVVSETNKRGHWRTHYKRTQMQRFMGRTWAQSIKVKFPITVTFTRLAPHGLDEGDNLNSAFKAIRDGIAEALGVNDRSKEYTWVYRQERQKEYGVRIEIEGEKA